jgi:hypothetical protein
VEEAELSCDLIELIPRMEEIFVKVEVLGVWN